MPLKVNQNVIHLSTEWEIISVDKKRGKVVIRNLATKLKQPDKEVDAVRIRTAGY